MVELKLWKAIAEQDNIILLSLNTNTNIEITSFWEGAQWSYCLIQPTTSSGLGELHSFLWHLQSMPTIGSQMSLYLFMVTMDTTSPFNHFHIAYFDPAACTLYDWWCVAKQPGGLLLKANKQNWSRKVRGGLRSCLMLLVSLAMFPMMVLSPVLTTTPVHVPGHAKETQTIRTSLTIGSSRVKLVHLL